MTATESATTDAAGTDATGREAAGTEGRSARQRNRRGQGEKLREDIIEAASRLLADPASPPLTLRAVAREVGVAATSVYLHFNDIQSLVLAVADRRFGELVQLQGQALAGEEGAASPPPTAPWDRVLAGCLAYCEFGLKQQGHYKIMFENPLPVPPDTPQEQAPGWSVFKRLVDAIAEAGDRDAPGTAELIWQQLHGIVSLRISRPRFPWKPLAETVADAVGHLLDGNRGLK
jgi:AcrR family transcriptional regulator